MESLIGFLIVAFIAWLLLRPSKRTTHSQRASTNKVNAKQASSHWQGTGDFGFEIVGESFHQDVLRRLAGEHPDTGADTPHIAELVLEDDNKYDAKAVAVKIQRQVVGHLSRDDARSFRRRLGQKGLTGVATTCDAKIVGGGVRKNGEKLHYGVRLDIKDFGN